MDNEFMVGMGKIAVEEHSAVLTSLGLGSCVGLALLDPEKQIGGLAHIMLPTSRGEKPQPITKVLLAIETESLTSRAKRVFISEHVEEIEETTKEKILEDYKEKKPDVLFMEITSLAEESYLLEQIKEHDIHANILLAGEIDIDLKPSLYNQDIYVVDTSLPPDEAQQVLNIVRNKRILKYADIAFYALLNWLEAKGAHRSHLKAKLAGGAKMFKTESDTPLANIGDNNVLAVKKYLREANIPILVEDVGGSMGRTVRFYPEDGKFIVRTKEETKEL